MVSFFSFLWLDYSSAMMTGVVLVIYFMLASCVLSQLGLMVLLLQELVRACSTRAFMVFEMKERMGI